MTRTGSGGSSWAQDLGVVGPVVNGPGPVGPVGLVFDLTWVKRVRRVWLDTGPGSRGSGGSGWTLDLGQEGPVGLVGHWTWVWLMAGPLSGVCSITK